MVLPEFVNAIFTEKEKCALTLRTQSDFTVPRTRTVHKGDDSLRHLGPLIWNIVPREIRCLPSLGAFKKTIKKWHPRDCPCRLCKPYVQGIGYLE